MTNGSAPHQRRDEKVFAAERPVNQQVSREHRTVAAAAGCAVDDCVGLAFALRQATAALTVTCEVAFRRLVDLALLSESRRVADIAFLAEETKSYAAWPSVRRHLLDRALIRIEAGSGSPVIAIALLDKLAGGVRPS
jgi:hypothetical protein